MVDHQYNRSSFGTYDTADCFDLLLTSQGVRSLRRQLAEAVFNIPPTASSDAHPMLRIRFGARISFIPNGCCAVGRRDG